MFVGRIPVRFDVASACRRVEHDQFALKKSRGDLDQRRRLLAEFDHALLQAFFVGHVADLAQVQADLMAISGTASTFVLLVRLMSILVDIPGVRPGAVLSSLTRPRK